MNNKGHGGVDFYRVFTFNTSETFKDIIVVRKFDSGDIINTLLPDEGKRVFSGSISCDQTYRIIISSINYYTQTSIPCNISCPPLSASYLDGSNTVCQNENVIRSSCYARNSCQLSNLPLPEDRCGLSDTVEKVKVYYHCIHKDLVFNLCERRALIVEKEAQIILTTPLSSQQTMSKSQCECNITSKYPDQLIGSAVKITRQRMAQLLDEHSLSFIYGSTPITVTTSYARLYLAPERVFSVGVYYTPELIIKYDNRESQDIYSKVFLTIEPGKDLMISCNGAEVSQSVASTPQITTQLTSQHVDSSTASGIISRTTFFLSTFNIANHADDLLTSESGKSTDGQLKLVVVGLAVTLVVMGIICIVFVATSCIFKRKLNRITKNGKANIAGSINLELSTLNQTSLEGDPVVTDHYEEVGRASVDHVGNADEEPYLTAVSVTNISSPTRYLSQRQGNNSISNPIPISHQQNGYIPKHTQKRMEEFASSTRHSHSGTAKKEKTYERQRSRKPSANPPPPSSPSTPKTAQKDKSFSNTYYEKESSSDVQSARLQYSESLQLANTLVIIFSLVGGQDKEKMQAHTRYTVSVGTQWDDVL
ncbi:uncharacterized protein [Watersipora subatra]|uniref:uncharacterized protein n=1 Tax=Watersipora subatra TaxID=2589382 RepID=UPI00355ACF91